MTKKDYIKLAAALAVNRPVNNQDNPITQFHKTVFAIADVLAADNDRFDRTRFLIAAGVIAS